MGGSRSSKETSIEIVATTGELRGDGWAVLRFWEHENPIEAVDSVTLVLENGRGDPIA